MFPTVIHFHSSLIILGKTRSLPGAFGIPLWWVLTLPAIIRRGKKSRAMANILTYCDTETITANSFIVQAPGVTYKDGNIFMLVFYDLYALIIFKNFLIISGSSLGGHWNSSMCRTLPTGKPDLT